MSPKSTHTHSSKPSKDSPYGPHNDSASARASVVSRITSASVLVLSKLDFPTWASRVGLDTNIESSIPSSKAFKNLRKLKRLSNRFPTWLTVENSPQFQFISSNLKPLADQIRTKLAGREPVEVDLELGALLAILHVCRHMRLLGTRLNTTETDRRHTIDTLIAHICDVDQNNDSIRYGTEQELNLPQAPFKKYNVTKARADGVMYLNVDNFQPCAAHPNMAVASKAFYATKGEVETVEKVHCVAEFKREDDGSNQAMMGMVSGLYQGRVLQKPGQFVFGVLHLQKIFFRVVAGIWQENKIQLYEIGCYAMTNPVEVLQFYLVLRGIHNRAGIYLDELRQSEESLADEVKANPPSTTWYPHDFGVIPEDPSESDQQPPPQGGADTQQDTSEQRHARDKVQSYLESISSSSAFLPVDLPPTPTMDSPSYPKVDSAGSPSMEPGLDDGSDSSSDESDTVHSLPTYVPVASQGHKVHLTVDPSVLMGRIQSEDV